MFTKLIKYFKKQDKGYLSGITFKESIKATGMELYKGVTILYLQKPSNVYHLFYNKEFYFGEAESFEEVQNKARYDIDTQFKYYEKANKN